MKVALGICLMLVVVGYIQAAPIEEVLLRRLIDALEETEKNEVVCTDNAEVCGDDQGPYCNAEDDEMDWFKELAEYLQKECPVLCGTCNSEVA